MQQVCDLRAFSHSTADLKQHTDRLGISCVRACEEVWHVVLGAPASQIGCERLWKLSGLVVSKKRGKWLLMCR